MNLFYENPQEQKTDQIIALATSQKTYLFLTSKIEKWVGSLFMGGLLSKQARQIKRLICSRTPIEIRVE